MNNRKASSRINTALLILVVIWFIPILGLFISSFRPRLRPSPWTAFTKNRIFTLTTTAKCSAAPNTRSSMRWATRCAPAATTSRRRSSTPFTVDPSVIIPILIAAAAAYGFAWMVFGRKFFFTSVVALLVVPLQIALIPILRDYQKIGLTGSYLGWLAHTGFGLPLSIYLLYNYISHDSTQHLPNPPTLTGHGRSSSSPASSCPSHSVDRPLAIFQFLWVWNDLLVAPGLPGRNGDVAVLHPAPGDDDPDPGTGLAPVDRRAFVSMVVPLAVFFQQRCSSKA